MDCMQCGENILKFEDICFFLKNESINLIVKHERLVFVEKNFHVINETTRKPIITCPKCTSPLGSKHPLGPSGTIICAFGNEKVILLKSKLKMKSKNWRSVHEQAPFNRIEVRNYESFFGSIIPSEHSKTEETMCQLPQQLEPIEPINFPDINDLSHFRYNDILTSPIVPRDYQTAAYIEALQRNLIIVLPTGSGKTLIATIIAAKMIQLNPNHMVLFIVERVPLVFQQGEAINCNTRLSVCCYCSETNTNKYRSQLKSGEFDILVSTAGAYLNLEREVRITKFCCVILDECHHATGDHGYVRILNLVRDCRKENQPRVVGLTASPPSGSMKGDIQGAILTLVEFISLFLGASVYYNESFAYISNDSTEKVIVPANTNEIFGDQIRILVDELRKFANYVNLLLGNPNYQINTLEDWKDPKNRINLMRVLEHLSKFFALDEYIKSMKTMCTALDITDLLGITYANQTLENLPVYSRLHRSTTPSPRLSILLRILEDLSEDSKVIIFVQTRQIAQILTTVLKQFPLVEKKFSPQKIVGQHGQLGMEWEYEQKEIIDGFRCGNCNLLVSTSVIEEGLDVSECDIVIRFDGIKSLLSYKQSKGRARKLESSKFILILSQSEEKIFDDIQASDIMLRSILEVIKTNADIPSKLTKDIQQKIESEKSESPVYNSIQPSECAIEVYLSGSCELIDIQDTLADILREKYFLKMKHIDQANRDSQWKSKGIFPPGDTFLIVGIQSQSHNIYQRYNQLSIEWNFALNNESTNLWSRLEVNVKEESEEILSLPVRAILWGKFLSKNTFQFNDNLKQVGNVVLNFQTKESFCIQIGPQLTIEIFLPSIHRFILLDWKESEVTMFIPLKCSPFVRYAFLGEKGKSERRTSDNCDLLQNFSEFPVVAITITYTNSEWYRLWTLLHSSTEFPVPLFDTRVTISALNSFAPNSLTSQPSYYEKTVQDCLWTLSVLKCCRNVYILEHSIDIILNTLEAYFNELGIQIVTNTLSRIVSKIYDAKTHYFFDLTLFFTEQLRYVRENIRSYSPITPPNYRYIESAIVTPSRVICLQQILTQENRLYRKFPDERFLNLAFREEKGGPLPQDERVLDRVRDIMEEGLTIDGNTFYFLTCSGSQLRSKRAIFIHIQDTPSSASRKIKWIRSQLLGQTQINNEIKYLSRLGLFSTSDYPSYPISEQNTLSLRDISAEDGTKLTDGAGKIRRRLAEEVIKKVKPIYPHYAVEPSALQIRLAGLKGVLTIVDDAYDPDFIHARRDCDIVYRDSMKKIDWTEDNLCVVKFSEYNELFLNMQMLTLLTSLEDPDGNWDPKPRLRELYKLYLENIAKIFTQYEIAQTELIHHLPNYFRETSRHFDILSEPYYLSLLRCIYTFNIRVLINRARLPVKGGCLLMGIPDPVGVLRDGEIFVQIQETAESELFYLDGRMLVYKNPCLHPGDLLTPTGVYIPELAHLRNVIVFPIRGTTSLPASTSGGDLDGDMFAIIWDPSLIPPPNATVPPLNYDEVLEEARNRPKYSEDSEADKLSELSELMISLTGVDPSEVDSSGAPEFSADTLADAYRKVISNDLLGIISHYHVSICDQMPLGARDKIAIELAKAASLAVDYPKTGIMPIIPKQAKDLILENGYPDFMEKKDSNSYPSTKLLGEFYHLAKSACYNTSEWKTLINYFGEHNFTQKLPGNFPIKNFFKVKGYTKFMEDARMKYHDYSNAFERILLSFGIETEAEAMLALVIDCHPLLLADKANVTKSLRAGIGYLIQEFWEKFHQDISPNESISKASAWYLAVYNRQENNQRIFYSFSWIVGKYLCQIASRFPELRYSINLHKSLGQTAREYIWQSKEYIDTVVESKRSAFPKVKNSILKFMSQRYPTPSPILHVSIFGSVSMYLCEPLSDLDISIALTPYGEKCIFNSKELERCTPKEKQKHILKVCAIPAVQSIQNTIEDKTGSEVPIISISIDSPQKRSTEEINIDIAASSDGVAKSEYITDLYRVTGGLFFGWLWLLVHWARHVGILKSHNAPGNMGIILTAEFEALVLYIYDRMKSKPKYYEGYEDLKTILNNLMDSYFDQDLGLMLEEFFWLGAKITSQEPTEIVYEWPILNRPTHTIPKRALNEISPLLFQGWHCLVFSRDISKLFESQISQVSLRKRFSLSMSDKLRQSTNFYKTQLANKTGALIAFDQIGRHVLISGRGSASAIHKLSSEISSLENSTALTYKYKSVSNPYMLEGSFALIITNQSCSPRVKIRNCQHNCFKLHHYHNIKSDILLASDVSGANDDSESDEESGVDWKTHAIARIQTLMWQQLSRFPVNTSRLLNNLEFKTRYGFYYILDGVDTFQSIGDSLSLEEFEQCLVKSKRFGKDFIDKFTESRTSPSKETNPFFTGEMERLHLSGSSSGKKFIAKKEKPKKEVIKSISSAFCPGIQLIDDPSQLSKAQLVYKRALESCGFKTIDNLPQYTWRIDSRVTVTRDIRLDFNDEFKLISFSESPYIWVLATIVGDRQLLKKTHDIRLRVESWKPIDRTTPFFQRIAPNLRNPDLLTLGADGLPVPCEYLNRGLKIIKHNTDLQFYQCNNVVAKVSSGTEYSGENVAISRRYCELTLCHSQEELREALELVYGGGEIRRIAKDAFEISYRVSEAISKFV